MGIRHLLAGGSHRALIAGVATVACATALACGTGCAAPAPNAGSAASGSAIERTAATQAVTFTDARGKKITVERPKRVVACMGSFAHIWELAGGELVGASSDAAEDYDIASEVTSVGDFTSPDLEQIIALKPDLVLMTASTGGRGGASSQVELAQSLEDAGITVACFKVTTFEDYLGMLRICTDITGRADLYQKNGQEVQGRIDRIREQVPAGEQPSVLAAITYSGGTRVQGADTAVGSIVAELGGRNIADTDRALLKDYSMESVIADDPDCILIVPMGNTDGAARKHLEESTAENPAWAELSAVKNDRYEALDPALFLHKPCERWNEAYQVVYDALYA
ncbi:MAG: ABC transporter substrate-binding protein [Coriobacteriaceae bacterium]|nr:ABC transporter substrate-binding protein [Coriobacteriaceae bacterium]